MNDNEKEEVGIDEEINKLEEEIEDLKKRFPAHSIKADMLSELEEKEEMLTYLKVKRKSES